MLIGIKLYGGMTCKNKDLPCYGSSRFQLDVTPGSTIGDVHKLLNLDTARNLVNIVNGHAQPSDYSINEECTISIFLPMSDRQYDLFKKI